MERNEVEWNEVKNPQLGVTRVRWAADSSLRFTPLRMTLQNQNESVLLHPRLYTQEESKEIDQSLDIYTSLYKKGDILCSFNPRIAHITVKARPW